jgi:hypothetical protein
MRVIENRRLAQAKTRRNAYEIPTWAIADAIRRRTNNPDHAGRHPPYGARGGLGVGRQYETTATLG